MTRLRESKESMEARLRRLQKERKDARTNMDYHLNHATEFKIEMKNIEYEIVDLKAALAKEGK